MLLVHVLAKIPPVFVYKVSVGTHSMNRPIRNDFLIWEENQTSLCKILHGRQRESERFGSY